MSRIKSPPNKIECKICNQVCWNTVGLSTHIRSAHKITSQKYYNLYLKSKDEDLCDNCKENKTTFTSITIGYKKYCSYKCALAVNITPDRYSKNPELANKISKTLKQTYINNPELISEKSVKVSIGLRNYYNKRNETSFESTYYLYLVKHTSRNIIKIGKTNNIKRRLSDLKKDYGNIELLYKVRNTHTTIAKLESYLHKHFSDYCEVQLNGSGKTEWFNACIESELLSIL